MALNLIETSTKRQAMGDIIKWLASTPTPAMKTMMTLLRDLTPLRMVKWEMTQMMTMKASKTIWVTIIMAISSWQKIPTKMKMISSMVGSSICNKISPQKRRIRPLLWSSRWISFQYHLKTRLKTRIKAMRAQCIRLLSLHLYSSKMTSKVKVKASDKEAMMSMWPSCSLIMKL